MVNLGGGRFGISKPVSSIISSPTPPHDSNGAADGQRVLKHPVLQYHIQKGKPSQERQSIEIDLLRSDLKNVYPTRDNKWNEKAERQHII